MLRIILISRSLIQSYALCRGSGGRCLRVLDTLSVPEMDVGRISVSRLFNHHRCQGLRQCLLLEQGMLCGFFSDSRTSFVGTTTGRSSKYQPWPTLRAYQQETATKQSLHGQKPCLPEGAKEAIHLDFAGAGSSGRELTFSLFLTHQWTVEDQALQLIEILVIRRSRLGLSASIAVMWQLTGRWGLESLC